MWSNRNPHLLLVGMQNNTTTLENTLPVFTKLNILITYDPATVLLGIYPNDLKTYIHIKTCTQMFIASLFIIAKTCPSVGERINKL